MLSISLKFLQGALKGANKRELAEVFTPEKIGEAASRKIFELLGRNADEKGIVGEVPEQALKEIVDETPAALGIMFSQIVDGRIDTYTGQTDILNSYLKALEIVASTSRSLKSSLALRGFLHRNDCISYWHLTSPSSVDVAKSSFVNNGQSIRLASGLEIYLLEEECTDEEIAEINSIIRRSPLRQLPKGAFEYRTDDKAAKLVEIQEFSVIFERLDPEREQKMREAELNPFMSGSLKHPIQWSAEIPDGAPSLLGLYESLPIALEAMSNPNKRLKSTLDQIEKISVKPMKSQ